MYLFTSVRAMNVSTTKEKYNSIAMPSCETFNRLCMTTPLCSLRESSGSANAAAVVQHSMRCRPAARQTIPNEASNPSNMLKCR